MQRLQRPPKRIVQEHRLNEVYRKRKDEERRRRMDEAAEEVARGRCGPQVAGVR